MTVRFPMSKDEASRLLSLEATARERINAPDRAKRILYSLQTLGHVVLSRDPGGHEWAVVLLRNETPTIVYSMAVDGE